MASQICEDAIALAVKHRNALLKVLSWNDVSDMSNQRGFYLPKEAWRLFTPHAPVRGQNQDFDADILWPDGTVTHSCIHWWGKEKDEYHLTRFNRIRNFLWRRPELAGDLLVLVRTSDSSFAAFILSDADEIEELQARLGVEVVNHWATYPNNEQPQIIDEAECIERHFQTVVTALNRLPSGQTLSLHAREAVDECVDGIVNTPADARLIKYMQAEYELFQRAEEKVYGPRIGNGFESMKAFIDLANTVLNSRKSRAGKSLENHVQHLLQKAEIPFDAQAASVKGRPDIIIPSAAAYADRNHARDRICVLGVKRTCKDRWRQVLEEAPGVERKHILTMQEGISRNQMEEMRVANVSLVVPKELHSDYPTGTRLELLTIEQFFDYARRLTG